MQRSGVRSRSCAYKLTSETEDSIAARRKNQSDSTRDAAQLLPHTRICLQPAPDQTNGPPSVDPLDRADHEPTVWDCRHPGKRGRSPGSTYESGVTEVASR